MRYILVLTGALHFGSLAIAQNDGPTNVTPEMLQKIKAAVEIQVTKYRQGIAKKDYTADRVDFSVDTFRIERIVAKRIEADYSTMGTTEAVSDGTEAYDKLMNKYYNKLLKLLKPEDKKVLIAAQKAWLQFRDAEFKLIGIMGKDEYSGGGSIQSNIAVDTYSELIVKRTVDIFNYYDNAIKEK